MPNIGATELIIILAILILLFGAAKLPQLARSIGTSARELRKGMSDDVSDDKPAAKSKNEA
ncbi:twin-arginine translocase TatA/TatE family subunit [Candidatus Saccharibacteria bacterium]|nr:twin-arginine translocase TatA/TatE family subunit [Candidatus Saccharibacteria bacterium]